MPGDDSGKAVIISVMASVPPVEAPMAIIIVRFEISAPFVC